jgi:pimeloyl-ACP methyl ester carboxylesterase
MPRRELAHASSNARSKIDLRRRLFMKRGATAAAVWALGPSVLATPSLAQASALSKYEVEWIDERLETLRRKVKSFEFPRAVPGSGWRYGVDTDYLHALVRYWAEDFDMEAAMKALNRYPQFITRVDDIDVQFIRVIGEPGPNKARLPLLSTHGWPGSTYEFWQAIEYLAFPSRFGAKPEVSFDLIIPSLPGYGASSKPLKPIGARTTARLWDKLMRENLGYADYYAQGGDWGAGVTGWLALDYPKHVQAIHLNLMIVAPQAPAVTGAEKRFYVDSEEAERLWGAYYQLQATDPQSLA